MASGLHIVSAGMPKNVQQFYSGEVDFFTLDWTVRLSGESISASGVSAFLNWYFPAGFTAYLSGTAAGASGMWMKLSATGAPANFRLSAAVNTTSGKRMIEWFDVQIWTGQV